MMKKQTILCVDDEIDNVEALERLLRTQYKVLKAISGDEALRILDQHREPIALIITDQRMPFMSGVEFLQKSMRTHPESVRILLTGYTDLESIVSAINTGQIFRYINKPWDPVDLKNTVERAVERFLLAEELKQKNLDLEKALEELKSLDQAKSQFMILINHELKTPLTSIMSYSDLLNETRLDEDQQKYVFRVRQGADRLKELIHDSLLIVSAETKTLQMKIQPFHPSQLDLTLKPEVEKMRLDKGMDLQVQSPDVKAIGDLSSLSQILRRLIHNAIKFGLEKTEIIVRCHPVGLHRLRWEVENQGSEISQATQEKILKPFFLDEDVMKHSSGVGLGLTVCQALLKAQSSHLEFVPSSGKVIVAFEIPCL